jgi:hypothetical protein
MEDIAWTAKLAAVGELRRVPLPLYRKRLHARNTHSEWLGLDEDRRREVWTTLCIGLVEAAALAAGSRRECADLLGRALERFAGDRDGRWMLFSPGPLSGPEKERFYREMLDRVAAAGRTGIGSRLSRAWNPRERAWARMLSVVEELRARW